MSFNTDGFGSNTTNTTGSNTTGDRTEGLRGSRGGVESTGRGTGSGVLDTASSGLGGYATQTQDRPSDDQTYRNADNTTPQVGHTHIQSKDPNQRAFGDSRSSEKPAFSGSDSAYKNTETGGAFSRSSEPGLNQRNALNDNTNTNTSSIPGTRSSGAASGGITDDVRERETRPRGEHIGSESKRDHNTGPRDEHIGSESKDRNTGPRDEHIGSDSTSDHKATFGDKMRGNVEKLAGAMTGKPELKERGQERKAGDL